MQVTQQEGPPKGLKPLLAQTPCKDEGSNSRRLPLGENRAGGRHGLASGGRRVTWRLPPPPPPPPPPRPSLSPGPAVSRPLPCGNQQWSRDGGQRPGPRLGQGHGGWGGLSADAQRPGPGPVTPFRRTGVWTPVEDRAREESPCGHVVLPGRPLPGPSGLCPPCVPHQAAAGPTAETATGTGAWRTATALTSAT